MEVTIKEQQNMLIAELVGRLDTPASPEVSAALQPMMDHADKTLVLDCTRLIYISSSGLRIFLTLRKAANQKGGRVVIRGMSADIRQVFMMTGFLNLFDIE